jgi:hypothetical protein
MPSVVHIFSRAITVARIKVQKRPRFLPQKRPPPPSATLERPLSLANLGVAEISAVRAYPPQLHPLHLSVAPTSSSHSILITSFAGGYESVSPSHRNGTPVQLVGVAGYSAQGFGTSFRFPVVGKGGRASIASRGPEKTVSDRGLGPPLEQIAKKLADRQ